MCRTRDIFFVCDGFETMGRELRHDTAKHPRCLTLRCFLEALILMLVASKVGLLATDHP